MAASLYFFNWSLSKAQDTESDTFGKARIRIIFYILLFSLLKAGIVIGFGSFNGEWLQVTRAAIAFSVYVILLKLLLYRPGLIKTLAHVMLLVGVLVVWTNIFVYTHKINLATVHFVFMITLSSFYILGNRFGLIYSMVSVLPVLLFLVFGGNPDIYWTDATQELSSPGYEIVLVLNFISIVVAHFLFFQAINLNILEKENLNKQLQVAIAEANELASSKSNFLSTMSHELRTPLNSVVGITELLLEDRPEERQKENLKILQYSAHDLLALINNILDFNKMDSDKVALESVPFNLVDFTQNICTVLRVKAHNKDLSLVLEVDEALKDVFILSDPTRLSQVMYNLIGNAVKFTEKGSIVVQLSLASRNDNSVEVFFSVTDTGIGIHPDKHESVFELFNQAESHLTRKQDGSGLGLAIVKKILLLFDSAIQLESSLGKGSKFFFTMPFALADDHMHIQSTEIGCNTDISKLKILIAEDNDVNRMILMKQMSNLGIDPVIVENGKDAYATFLASDFDAILMDLHMPVQGGYETIAQIRAIEDTVKSAVFIIAFTASTTEQQKILDAGFNDYLYKPVNMADLREKMTKVAQMERNLA